MDDTTTVMESETIDTRVHNIESITANHELVKINGNWYEWSDIAHCMDTEMRERIHGGDEDTIETFWDAYTAIADGTDKDAEWILSVIPTQADPAVDPATAEDAADAEGHQLECVCADCAGAELTAEND